MVSILMIVCQLRAVAAADVPHGSYSLEVSRERPDVFDEKWKRVPSCGDKTDIYLRRHSSFEVSFNGAVMVDKEEWIFDGPADSSLGTLVSAHRPKPEVGLTIAIGFRVTNDRVEGFLNLFVTGKDKKSHRCGDVRTLSGTYKP